MPPAFADLTNKLATPSIQRDSFTNVTASLAIDWCHFLSTIYPTFILKLQLEIAWRFNCKSHSEYLHQADNRVTG